jgi:hypothetical protein
LQPGCDVDPVAVQITAVGDRVADFDTNAEPDASLGRLLTVIGRHETLSPLRTSHGSIDAVEYDQERVASGLDDPPTMFFYRRFDQCASEHPQARYRIGIIEADQPAIADHIHVHDGDQFADAARTTTRWWVSNSPLSRKL